MLLLRELAHYSSVSGEINRERWLSDRFPGRTGFPTTPSALDVVG